MSRAKWVMAVALLALASMPASASDLFPNKIVPAVLHIPGPDEPPLYSDIEFAKAPAIVPGSLCEARCMTDFRTGDSLLDVCLSGCISEI
jgi:hypothetical protein